MSYPSAEALGEYFQHKYVVNDETPFALTVSNRVPILDDPISDTEITKASKKLKENQQLRVCPQST